MRNIVYIGMQSEWIKECAEHSHSFWEITYYTEGYGVNYAWGREYPFHPGSIICHPPGMMHRDHSETGYRNIYFMVENFDFNYSFPIHFDDTPHKDFLYMLRLLYHEFYFSGDSGLLNAILGVLNVYLAKQIGADGRDEYVERIRQDITENFSNGKYEILEKVKQLPFSVNQFRKKFEAEVGMPPKTYLQMIRIAHAKNLLVNSSKSVTEVGQLCGYGDAYYFSRIFKKYCGMSPQQWRMEQKNEEKNNRNEIKEFNKEKK